MPVKNCALIKPITLEYLTLRLCGWITAEHTHRHKNIGRKKDEEKIQRPATITKNPKKSTREMALSEYIQPPRRK